MAADIKWEAGLLVYAGDSVFYCNIFVCCCFGSFIEAKKGFLFQQENRRCEKAAAYARQRTKCNWLRSEIEGERACKTETEVGGGGGGSFPQKQWDSSWSTPSPSFPRPSQKADLVSNSEKELGIKRQAKERTKRGVRGKREWGYQERGR